MASLSVRIAIHYFIPADSPLAARSLFSESIRLFPVLDRPLVIVDLETTGGHITRDRITEIGLIAVDGERVERWSSLVNPGQPIPPFIEQITGISDRMVADAPPFAALADEVLERLSGRLFIAHNARFDYGFLKNEFRRVGLRFHADQLCTVKLSRALYPQHFKHNLDSLIARFGIDVPPGMRHRALGDAEAVRVFLEAAGRELGRDVVLAATHAQALSPDLPPGIDPDVADALPDVPGAYLFHADDDTLLYVGKSANLRSGVLAHFAASRGKGRMPRFNRPVARIDWHEAVGEFGAQLLQIRLIRQRAPLHNVHHAGGLVSFRLDTVDGGFLRPVPVSSDDVDFSRTESLYGVFRSSREASRALVQLADAYQLCQARLGLETLRTGRPCGGYGQGRCKGTCLGREPALHFNARLLKALGKLKLKSWPYPGAIDVIEADPVSGDSIAHRFDHWRLLGSFRPGEAVPVLAAPFDAEIYKLLLALFRKAPVETRIVAVEETAQSSPAVPGGGAAVSATASSTRRG